MTQEPLKDQIEKLIVRYTSTSGANGSFIAKEILKLFQKQLDKMIQIHEEKIEELIKEVENNIMIYENDSLWYCDMICKEYESIMILEAGLEDVI